MEENTNFDKTPIKTLPLDFWDDDIFGDKPKVFHPKIDDDMLRLPSGKVIRFNEEQYEAIKRIRLWLKSKNTFMTLSGFAGTGKSTVIKKIVDEYRYGVIVSAPTHKAKKVIQKFTGVEGKTLHSLLGLRPDVALENFSPNFPEFAPIAKPKIDDYNFVIIDEASMMNQALYNLIEAKVKNTKTKILFMGDPAQLPPINETLSVVFDSTKNEYYCLTKIERQLDTNPLLFLYDDMRNNLESPDGGFKRITNVNDLGEGVTFTLNKQDFRQAVIDKFTSVDYKLDSDFCKGLAWRNETVMQSNKLVRDFIFGEDSDVVELDDVIMGYRTISNESQTVNIIENSEDYKIVYKSPPFKNGYGINGFNVRIKSDDEDGKPKIQSVFIVDANDEENLYTYGEMHDFFMQSAKMNNKLWKKYYTFRRDNLLMKSIDKERNGQFRDAKEVIVKDLDYGYFLTIHKSQGSTYQHVMISESDMFLNRNLVERNKLAYVAYSRPQVGAYVLTTKLDG